MATRLELQHALESILGSRNVYFQPPTSTMIQYDAIVYKLKDIYTTHADNLVYNRTNCYEVTVVYRDPDSDITRRVMELPMCSFDRYFASEGLNHDVLTLYY